MDRIGPFVLGETLGRGGMGVVLAAVHEPSGLDVAVKLLDREGTAELAHEVEAVAALDHPGVVMVFDHGVVDGRSYLVMERASRGSLRFAPQPSEWQPCLETLCEILQALAHAHARGVIHRDIKPGNVLCRGPGDLRQGLMLADFGLAWSQGQEHPTTGGTPYYMAPEQIQGRARELGPWTDLFAVGNLAWELLTGRPPFKQADLHAVLADQVSARPGAFQPRFAVPGGLEDLLRRLLLKDPWQRPEYAADVACALLELGPADVQGAGGGPTESPVESRTWSATLDMASTFFGALPAVEREPDLDDGGPDTLAARPPPEDWRVPAQPPPVRALAGAGLGLFALRTLPLVGREAERDALWAALGEVWHGWGTATCVVTGPQGVGRTRLLRWLAERAVEVGAGRVVWAGAAVGDTLGRMFGTEGLDPLAADQQARRALAARGVDAEPPSDIAGLSRLLALLADERPVILLLDDPADEALQLVRELYSAQARCLVVVAARDDVVSEQPRLAVQLGELYHSVGAGTLPLSPLSDEQLRYLLTLMLGLDPAVQGEVLGRAQGSPQLALLLLADWIAGGLLRPGLSGFVADAERVAAMPVSVAENLHLRLHRLLAELPPGARRAALVAAVLGHRANTSEWAAVCSLSDVERAARVLVRAGLARRDEEGLGFRHGTAREGLCQLARDEGTWAALNLACAEVLLALEPVPAERIGRHLADAGQPERALPFLQDAIARYNAAEHYEQASALAERLLHCLGAIGAPEDDPRCIRTHMLQASIAANTWQTDRALDLAGRALVLAMGGSVPEMLGNILRVNGLIHLRLGHHDRAVELLDRALPYMDVAGLRAAVLRGKAMALTLSGRTDEAAAPFAEARALSLEVGDAYGSVIDTLSMAREALLAGRLDEAWDTYAEAVAASEAQGWTERLAGLAGQGRVRLEQRRFDEAERLFDEVVRESDRQLLVLHLVEGLCGQLLCDATRGSMARWDGTLQRIRHLVQQSHMGHPDHRAMVRLAGDRATAHGRGDLGERARLLAEEMEVG